MSYTVTVCIRDREGEEWCAGKERRGINEDKRKTSKRVFSARRHLKSQRGEKTTNTVKKSEKQEAKQRSREECVLPFPSFRLCSNFVLSAGGGLPPLEPITDRVV